MADAEITRDELIDRIATAVEPDQRIRALFLAGSLGSGTADRFSDVDLLAIAARESHEPLAEAWRELLGRIVPVVYFNRLPAPVPILNAISSGWLRCDLLIADRSELARRSRDSLRVLIDRDQLYAELTAQLPPQPSRERVTFLIQEFIRVLGLMPVAIGRGEYVLGVIGGGLLRQHLLSLLLETAPKRGGMLRLSGQISDADLTMLRELPIAAPTRQSVIDANLACAREFLPRAKQLAKTLGIPWPEEFEAATARHLQQELEIEI